MRFLPFLLAFALPASAWAQTRTLTVSAPSQVYAGQSFTVPTSASTNAGGGEQIGFYHGQYSTDGGGSWTWFTSDVNVGTSATRNAYVTAGAAGTTVIVRAKVAFRDGPAGDVDYDGNPIDWGGSWGADASPPARYAYISVVAPPNQAPTIAWTQAPAAGWINEWFAVQARGNDADGNLSSVSVWKEWVPFAFNGGGNGWEAYSDANMASAPWATGIAFQAQSGDSAGATSAFISHTVPIYNRAPTGTFTVNGSAGNSSITFGQSVAVSSSVSDPDGNISVHSFWWDQGSGLYWTHPFITWDYAPNSAGWFNLNLGANGYNASGYSSTRGFDFRPTKAATFAIHNAVADPYQWIGVGASVIYLTVNKATPAGTFANRTLAPGGPTYTVQSADLNATFSHPFSGAVAGPTGTVTYTLVAGGSGSVTAGTQLAAGSTYTVRASYAGDVNYHPTSVDAVWTIGPEPTYTLTVENGTGGASGLTIGTSRSITANAPQSGQVFIDWTVVAGPGTIANASATSTTFTMGAGNATVRANFASFLPNGDDDGDGMTNQWEVDNGLDRNNANDALLDPDGDGLTNIAEYNLGTHPQQYNVGTSAQGNSLPAGWDLQLKAVNGRTESVGGTAGEFSVDKSGAATYSIPFWVSPGTAGMEPKITLNYSSQAGYGIAGHGWSIGGLSSITRGPKTRASDDTIHGVNLSRDDQYYLDGQRLKYVGGTGFHSYAGAEYRTEMDSFTRVVAQGFAGEGPESFKAWTKAGLIIEFGGTALSRLKANAPGRSEIVSWAVSRISDTSGNYMDFIYANDEATGEQRIVRIEYTGHAGSPVVAPYAALEFEYEARGDTRTSYVAGSRISATQRLKRIKATQGGGVLRTYTLNYLVRGQTNRSLLAEVIESGTYGGALPSLFFEYEEQTGGWAASPLTPPVPLGIDQTTQAGTGFIDLNGDGKADFVAKKYNSSNQLVLDNAWLNMGTHWELATAYRLPGAISLGWDTRNDTGSRFVDLDGDGRVDLLFAYKENNGSVSRYAYRNTGSGWEERPDWNLPNDVQAHLGMHPNTQEPITQRADRGRRLVDVNGDGLPDLVWRGSFRRTVGTSLTWVYESGCYLNNIGGSVDPNNPAKWIASSAWTPPLDVAAGAVFMDVNGDGLPDQVMHNYGQGSTRIGIALNSPSGFGPANYEEYGFDQTPEQKETSFPTKFGGLGRYIPPVLLNFYNDKSRQSPTGTEIVDLNGDGLVDAVFSSQAYNHRKTYLNTGNGWVASSAFEVPAGFWLRGTSHAATGAAIVDVNGDGLPDLVRSTEGGTNIYYLGTGSGWGAYNSQGGPGNLLLPRYLVRSNWEDPAGSDLVDLNGDGVLDMAWNLSGGGSGAQLNTARQMDRLTKVTNSFDTQVFIEYKPLTDPEVYTRGSGATYPVTDVIGPMYVVSKVRHGQMYGGGTDDQTYGYGKLRSHAKYGSLGFEWTTVRDHRTNFRTTTTYRQDFPFIGMAADTFTKRDNGAGHTLSESSIVYDVKSLNGGATRFVFAKESLQQSYDFHNGSLVGYNRTVTQRGGLGSTGDYDDYGNSKYQEVHTSAFAHKVTESTFDNIVAADKWHLGRLTRSTVTHVANGLPTIVRVSAFEYDPNTGLLTKEIVEPDSAANPANLTLTTTYQHDAFGNRTSVSVAGGGLPTRTTTTSYNPADIGASGINGRFPVRLTNAKGHSETYGYHQGFGVPSSQTGPNGLTTSWQFDNLGRKSREDRPDGTHTIWTYNWAHESTSPGGQYYIETRSSGAPPTIVFYNNWGKQTTSYTLNGGLNDGNARIVGVTTGYDGWGRATSTSLPFYYGGTVEAASITTYDLLDRPVTVQTRHETINGTWLTTTMAYDGLTTRVTNPKGQQTETTKNLEGQVIRVVNNALAAEGAADRGRVEYVYDSTGNLMETRVFRDGSNYVATVLNYDVRGRKTSMVDPDMGTWSYTYNAAGELKTQTDAKGQTTTMNYDDLGRLISRVEPEGTTTWTYDTSPKGASTWKGSLHTVSGPTDRGKSYSETHLYDSLGRPATVTRTIDGQAYGISQAYDAFNRPTVTTYPTGFKVENKYNAFGFLKEVREGGGALTTFQNEVVAGQVFWQADRYALTGEVDGSRMGNGLTYDRIISNLTGRVQAIATGVAPLTQVQNHQYTYDEVGNVTRRYDVTTGRDDRFTEYDGLNRLKQHQVIGGALVTIQYNSLGNITQKSDVGSYTYHATKVHAVESAGGSSYTYDANGNMLTGGGRTLEWTSFNQLRKVTQSGQSAEFWFGAARERVFQQHSNGTKTSYVGALFEKVEYTGGLVEQKHYIMTPLGRTAVRTLRNDAKIETRYFHQDALGSIAAVTDEFGKVEKRYTFDAWGKRVQTANTYAGTGNQVTRGYTDHEHLEDFGLIHMNGRVYDPVLARFLSADPFIGDASDSESYNRYSYVNNNPVNAIDPSGYFLKKLFKIVAIAVAAVFTAGAALYAVGAASSFLQGVGMAMGLNGGLAAGVASSGLTVGQLGAIAGAAGGFGSGFAGSLLNGGNIGDAFKAGLIGGLVGGATAGIGVKFGGARLSSSFRGWSAHKLLHGMVGGVAHELQGGEFRHGFYSSVVAKTVSQQVGFALDDAHIGNSAERYVAEVSTAAVVGGTTSAISGGKFENGATTAAFQHMFNQALTSTIRQMEAQAIRNQYAAYDKAYTDKKTIEMAKAGADYAVYGAAVSLEKTATVGELTVALVNAFSAWFGRILSVADQPEVGHFFSTGGEAAQALAPTMPLPAVASAVGVGGAVAQVFGEAGPYGTSLKEASNRDFSGASARFRYYLEGGWSSQFHPKAK